MAKTYIEREAVAKKITDFKRHIANNNSSNYLTGYICALSAMEGLLASQPAADVVEVVSCKDCKRSGMYAFGCGDKEELACLEIEEDGFILFATAVDPNGYCSNGERKDDADN